MKLKRLLKIVGIGLGLGIVAAVALRLAIRTPLKNAERWTIETQTRNELTLLRAAAELYAAEHSRYPKTLGELQQTTPPLLNQIPAAKLPPHHPDTAAVKTVSRVEDLDDAGGWLYSQTPRASDEQRLFINCSHLDSSGRRWADY